MILKMSKNIICIIPARKGSKRLKNKNIRKFFGHPLISYPILLARKSFFFKDVFVSTDCQKIKKISERYGAKVPYVRSKRISNDNTTVNAVISYFLKKVKLHYKIDVVVVMYPTSVFVTKRIIKKIINKINEKINFALTIKRFSHPIQRALIIKNKSLQFVKKKMKNKRTQDLYQTFYDAGQIYAYKYNSLIKNETFFKKNTDFVKLGYLDAIDIDNLQDFKDALNLYKFIKNNER